MATPRRSRIVKALVLVASILLLAAPDVAASKTRAKKPPVQIEPPMQVYLVRTAYDGCEPDCPEWIAAQGRIDAASLGRFKKVLNQLGKRTVPVLIHSGGGLADDGLAIGRLLRARGLDVGVGKTVFTPCAPEAAACRKKARNGPLRGLPDTDFSICASSCAFILAAGVRRFVGLLSLVGVHRSVLIQAKVLQTFKMKPYRASNGSVRYKRQLVTEKIVSQRQVSAPQKTYDRYEKYFAEMGTGKEIMPLMLAAPNSSIHWLRHDELRATRIATHRMDGGQLVLGASAPDDGWTGPGATIMTGPGLPPEAQDCTRNGLGCPWGTAPDASSGGSGVFSSPSR